MILPSQRSEMPKSACYSNKVGVPNAYISANTTAWQETLKPAPEGGRVHLYESMETIHRQHARLSSFVELEGHVEKRGSWSDRSQ
jgi:hypothetical protein